MKEFQKYGKPSRIIKNCFGGKQEYRDALKALENEIYKAG